MRSSRATRESAVPDLAEALRQGAYMTDGSYLFRVVGVIFGSSGPRSVELEDCRTLEVHTYSGPDVMALGLTPVAAAHAGDPAHSAEVGLEPLE